MTQIRDHRCLATSSEQRERLSRGTMLYTVEVISQPFFTVQGLEQVIRGSDLSNALTADMTASGVLELILM